MTALLAPPRPRIRGMRERHLAAVVAIERQVYPRPWSRSLFLQELARDDRVYLVALAGRRVGAEVVGYGGVSVAVGEAHILTVAVAPGQQGHGVGRALVVALLRAARQRGAQAATLEVRTSNLRARRLYERLGFVSVGVRPGYYEDNGEGAVIMWRHDLDD